jgi:hypothetical protein
LPLFAAFGASLSASASCFRQCPPAATRDRFPITLDKNGPNFLFTRGVLGGDVKLLLCGLRLITTKFMH